jgi:hypothetical protein
MAEIHVERKPRGGRALVVVLVLLLLVAAAWWLLRERLNPRPDAVPADTTAVVDSPAAAPAVTPAPAPAAGAPVDSAPGIVGDDTTAQPDTAAGEGRLGNP